MEFTGKYGSLVYSTREYRESVNVYQGPYTILVKVKNVLCPDGIYRTTKRVSEPDTYFTIPASIQVRGKTVSGFLFIAHDVENYNKLQTCFYPTGKNSDVFAGTQSPQFPDDEARTLFETSLPDEEIVPTRGEHLWLGYWRNNLILVRDKSGNYWRNSAIGYTLAELWEKHAREYGNVVVNRLA